MCPIETGERDRREREREEERDRRGRERESNYLRAHRHRDTLVGAEVLVSVLGHDRWRDEAGCEAVEHSQSVQGEQFKANSSRRTERERDVPVRSSTLRLSPPYL